jgi:hypothetical protein
MAIIVIGGHSRNIGKTSVVAGLIAALPACNWTAFKITQFGHGVCSRNGKPCGCAPEDRCWAMTEERDRSGRSDTSRFLVSGARQAFWVRTEQGRLHEAMSAIQSNLANVENAIIESNSILEFVEPDLYITVLDPATEDFKASAKRYLDRADAIVLHGTEENRARWFGIPAAFNDKPVFRISPPPYVSTNLVEFVAQRLNRTSIPKRADEYRR